MSSLKHYADAMNKGEPGKHDCTKQGMYDMDDVSFVGLCSNEGGVSVIAHECPPPNHV